MRVTVMPGHKKPWIVDGCGQLSGWGLDWKRLYGPAPQGQLYDIAATNGTGEAVGAFTATCTDMGYACNDSAHICHCPNMLIVYFHAHALPRSVLRLRVLQPFHL